MDRPSGSKPRKNRRRRTLPTSWRQRALEGGSRDGDSPLLPPTTPRNPGVVVGVHPDLDTTNNNTDPNTSPNTELCRPASELLEHQHREPAAIAQHLEHFLRHHAAWRIVSDYGPDLVNQVLQELPHTDGVNNPAGWLNWRVKALANGAAPMPPPASPQDKYEQDYARKKEQDRSKYLDAYRQRHGGDPWELDPVTDPEPEQSSLE